MVNINHKLESLMIEAEDIMYAEGISSHILGIYAFYEDIVCVCMDSTEYLINPYYKSIKKPVSYNKDSAQITFIDLYSWTEWFVHLLSHYNMNDFHAYLAFLPFFEVLYEDEYITEIFENARKYLTTIKYKICKKEYVYNNIDDKYKNDIYRTWLKWRSTILFINSIRNHDKSLKELLPENIRKHIPIPTIDFDLATLNNEQKDNEKLAVSSLMSIRLICADTWHSIILKESRIEEANNISYDIGLQVAELYRFQL